jgi:hypothetical protein
MVQTSSSPGICLPIAGPHPPALSFGENQEEGSFKEEGELRNINKNDII